MPTRQTNSSGKKMSGSKVVKDAFSDLMITTRASAGERAKAKGKTQLGLVHQMASMEEVPDKEGGSMQEYDIEDVNERDE